MRDIKIGWCNCGCDTWSVLRDDKMIARDLDRHEARCIAALLIQMEQIRFLATVETPHSVN